MEHFPFWSDVEISWSARYLGFVIGPDRSDKSWTKAIVEFKRRIQAWELLHLGMQCNAAVYRVFCSSIFAFLWQLEEIPQEVLHLEAWALRRLAPGPGNWIRPVELRHLQDKYSHPFCFPSFINMALSARIRLIEYEPQLNLQHKISTLSSLITSPGVKNNKWKHWYDQSHVHVLQNAYHKVQLLGINVAGIRSELQREFQGKHGSALESAIKKGFQARIHLHLLRSESYNHGNHLRSKLRGPDRNGGWSTGILPGILERRAPNILKSAFDLVGVKVAIVLFRTWHNGWCTAERFQNHTAKCMFHCSSTCSEDSVKHYAYCEVVRHFGEEQLMLPKHLAQGLRSFLCLDSNIPDEVRTLQLLKLYAVYNATNCLRFSEARRTITNHQDLLLQYVHQGTFNHSQSQQVVKDLHLVRKRRKLVRNASL